MEHPSHPELDIQHFDSAGPHLRIAVVTETYPPEINGVAHTLSRLVQALAERQHRVQLIRLRQPTDSAGASADAREVLMRGMPIPRYPGLRMGLPCKGALVKLWSTHRPDVVHIATEGPLGWSALQAAQQLRLPMSSDFRTNFHAYSQHYGMGALLRSIMLLLRKFHNRAHLTMVPTPELQQQLSAAGFKHLVVVGRGVDVRQFHPRHRSESLRQQWGAQPGHPVVLCLGRLAAEKNLDLAVRAFEALQHQSPGARLVFVGDGPLRESLGRRCPGAQFTGSLRGEALATAVASADLMLFPSTTETFGNVVVEAMASGVCVLSYRLAAAGQYIRSGFNGWTVEAGCEAAFIDTAVGAALAVEHLRQLGAKASQDMQRLDWGSIARQVEQELLRVIHRQQPQVLTGISSPSWVAPS